MAHKTDYKNALFDQRKYRQIHNSDGTVSFEDVTNYTQVGDRIGAKYCNEVGMALNALENPAFTQAELRQNINSREEITIIFGKIKRWLADLTSVAFSGSYTDLGNKPAIPSGAAASCAVANNDTTTLPGAVADARIVQVHGKEIDQINTEFAGFRTSFQAGCSKIAAAVTSMGVSTPSNANPDIISANIKKIKTVQPLLLTNLLLQHEQPGDSQNKGHSMYSNRQFTIDVTNYSRMIVGNMSGPEDGINGGGHNSGEFKVDGVAVNPNTTLDISAKTTVSVSMKLNSYSSSNSSKHKSFTVESIRFE